jgi:acyl transferase domain-containing protein
MSQSRDDIAIIGMACIYPGAPNLKAFWQNILSKVDATSDPPESWRIDDFYDPESTANDRIYCKRGGFIEELAEFNPKDYGIMPNAVDGGDPEHFLSLQVANEALADAGYLKRPFSRQRTAIILGRGNWVNRGYFTVFQHVLAVNQTLDILKRLYPEMSDADLQRIKEELKGELPPFNADTCPGLVPNLVTGRIANRLDLKGPNFTVDAACASSLIALDIGMRELLSSKCDMVIVGGANVNTPLPLYMIFCQLDALSRKGRIRPFDKDADGTLLGEGIGMIVIKRREDAEHDGDRIYALIKGVGVSSDGRALGVLVPRLEGECLALQRAYEATGISPKTIGLIEAHGTGTKVGDLTEIRAMMRMLGPSNGDFPHIAIGSVKSMISHTLPAAGMAGLIKLVLALYHKILPPTLCDEPNPEFQLEKTSFYVNTETRPWIHGEQLPRRAGVNAFGFGGINAHAILEEYTGRDGERQTPYPLDKWDTEVIIVQGESRESLIKTGKQLLCFMSKNPEVDLKDVAYTLNCPLRRSAGCCLAIVASSSNDLEKKLDYALNRLAKPKCQHIKDRSGIFFFDQPLGRHGKIAFLFPGEGSQYVNMLSDLCIHFPEVKASFDRADRVFVKNKRRPLPSQVVFPPPNASSEVQAALKRALLTMEYGVQFVLAANYGLKCIFDRLEILPQALVGHSSGEITALLASGIVGKQYEDSLLQHSLEINLIHQSTEKHLPMAKLLAVGAADPSVVYTIAAESAGELCVAMDNCPNQLVLCGSEAAIDDAYERLKKRGAICSFLPFDRASHSPWCQPVCDNSARYVEKWTIQPSEVNIYSYVTAELYPKNPDEARKIIIEQWARPVRFRETIEAMYDAGVRIFAEVGPNDNLTSFVNDTLEGHSFVAVPANVPTRSGICQLNHMVGLLAAHGVPMRLDYFYSRRNPKRLSIQEDIEGYPKKTLDEADGKKKRAAKMKLSLALPHLTLDRERDSASPERKESLNPAPVDRVRREPMPELKPSLQNRIQTESVSGNISEPQGSSVLSSVLASEPVQLSSGPDNPVGAQHIRSRVMEEYLRSMERFLGQQQAIMGAYLKKKNQQM